MAVTEVHQHVAVGHDHRGVARGVAGTGLEGGIEDMRDVAQVLQLRGHVVEVERVDGDDAGSAGRSSRAGSIGPTTRQSPSATSRSTM